MNSRSGWLAAALSAAVLLSSTLAAQDAGKVTGSFSVLQLGRFQGMCLLEIDGRPSACFGLHTPMGGKTRYTYLLLFKPDPKSERGSGVGGGGSATLDSDGAGECDLKFTAMPLGREIEIEYKLKTDGKTIMSETLKVAGQEYGKDGPRVFLVDLAAEKPACQPVKTVPAAVPDFADEEGWGKQILKAKAELIEKSPEAKAFFTK